MNEDDASSACIGQVPWRTGRKVGRTVYDANDVLIGVMDTPELAVYVVHAANATAPRVTPSASADLRAWQEIAERHGPSPEGRRCEYCARMHACPDRQAADAALTRLDALWGADANTE